MTTAPRYLAQLQYAETEQVDLCIAAVEYTRGDIADAARVLCMGEERLIAYLRNGRRLKRPMPLFVCMALTHAITKRAAAEAPAG